MLKTLGNLKEAEIYTQKALELNPDLVILDLQIGNMGGVATSLDLRHEISAGRLKPMKIMMLLDRDADLWIASEAQVDAKLVKPLNALQLRKKAEALL